MAAPPLFGSHASRGTVGRTSKAWCKATSRGLAMTEKNCSQRRICALAEVVPRVYLRALSDAFLCRNPKALDTGS